MDILKKAVLLVAILSISVFVAGCGGEDAADDADAQGGTEQGGSGLNLDGLEEKMDEAQEE